MNSVRGGGRENKPWTIAAEAYQEPRLQDFAPLDSIRRSTFSLQPHSLPHNGTFFCQCRSKIDVDISSHMQSEWHLTNSPLCIACHFVDETVWAGHSAIRTTVSWVSRLKYQPRRCKAILPQILSQRPSKFPNVRPIPMKKISDTHQALVHLQLLGFSWFFHSPRNTARQFSPHCWTSPGCPASETTFPTLASFWWLYLHKISTQPPTYRLWTFERGIRRLPLSKLCFQDANQSHSWRYWGRPCRQGNWEHSLHS